MATKTTTKKATKKVAKKAVKKATKKDVKKGVQKKATKRVDAVAVAIAPADGGIPGQPTAFQIGKPVDAAPADPVTALSNAVATADVITLTTTDQFDHRKTLRTFSKTLGHTFTFKSAAVEMSFGDTVQVLTIVVRIGDGGETIFTAPLSSLKTVDGGWQGVELYGHSTKMIQCFKAVPIS